MTHRFWLPIVLMLCSCRDDSVKETDGIDSGETSTDMEEAQSDIEAPPITLSRDAMVGHLQALMNIAEENNGNREAGSPGYAASVAYVRSQLEAVGYSVLEHEFNIVNAQWEESPVVQIVDGEAYGLESDFAPLSYTGSGTVTAPVQAVNIMIPPGDENSSESGCAAADFEDFVAGSIALIQRGTCTFQVKSENALAAGASAVLIFNEGQPGRRGVFPGALEESYENPIPVFSTSYGVGVTLSELDEDALVTVESTVSYQAIPTQNVVVETGGDPSRVVVVGGHLDSVGAGPGINDNGSGVAMILEMAIQVANEGIEPDNQLRFMFWGGEELGLLGSMDYVFGLNEAERANILANLNFDMIASPNPARMVYDGSGSLGGDPGPAGSAEIEEIFAEWFDAQGLLFQETPFDGRSDYGPFILTGIPAGGLFTGAEQYMIASEATDYEGQAGLPYDACYHQGCDTMENLDLTMLDEMAAAATYTTLQLGSFDGDFGAGPYGPPALQSVHPILPDMIPSGCGAHAPIWRR